MRTYRNQPIGTVPRARALRRNATEAEKHLRRALKAAFPGLKWRFQVPIGPYIADFLCFSARLVIELDGGQHAEATDYDAARTRFIEREGYRVLRFWNNDVLENVEGVIEAIQLSLSPWEGRVNGAPRCSGHARGMADPTLEGAAQRRKGEGDKEKGEPLTGSPSPSQPSTEPLPLPMGEEV